MLKIVLGLTQSLSATSRNEFVEDGEKNMLKAKAFQRY